MGKIKAELLDYEKQIIEMTTEMVKTYEQERESGYEGAFIVWMKVCKFGTDFEGNKCGIICADARDLLEGNNLLEMIENMFDQIKEKLENQGLTKNPKLFTIVSFEKVN